MDVKVFRDLLRRQAGLFHQRHRCMKVGVSHDQEAFSDLALSRRETGSEAEAREPCLSDCIPR